MSRLDPVAQQMIDETKASGQPNAHLLPIPAARERFEAAFASLEKPTVRETRDVTIPTRDGELIRARLYVPNDTRAPGLVLYFHGGGWLLGSIDSHDVTTRKLAEASGVPVLSVDYRRGPEWRFPTAVNDALDALAWATAEANPLRLSDVSRVAVAGDSAGGNLAAAVANETRHHGLVRHQLLAYPVTTCDLDRGMDPEFDGIMLERDELQWHQDNYLASAADREDPRLDLLSADLTGVPEATVILAECDPIRPQGEAYADALRAAGVRLEVRQYAGMLHGFFGLDELFEVAGDAMKFAGNRLAEALR
jgi:acetyl esterase